MPSRQAHAAAEASNPVDTLLQRGVLVCITGQDDQREKAHSAPFFKSTGTLTTLSASGTFIPCSMLGPTAAPPVESSTSASAGQNDKSAQGCSSLCVMTSAALVWPFMKRRPDVTIETLAAMTSDDLIPYTTLAVLCPTPKGPKWAEAKLSGIIEVPGAVSTAARMSAGEIPLEGCGRSWEFGWRPYSSSGFATSSAAAGGSGRPAPLPFNGVGHLAFLEVEVPALAGRPSSSGSHVQPHPCLGGTDIDVLREPVLQRGDWLALGGSPFGALAPGTFFNSVSVGILSNLLQPVHQDGACSQPSLISVDARLLPGQEGGPVVDRDGRLVGIMTLPIRLARAGTELPLCLSIGAILNSLSSKNQEQKSHQTAGRTTLDRAAAQLRHLTDALQGHPGFPAQHRLRVTPEAIVAKASRAVVLVDTGSSWGTGIAVSHNGFIVTNAHVVANASTVKIRVDHSEGPEWYTGYVIYQFQGPLDLAVLKICTDRPLPTLSLASATPGKGHPVFAVGHAMLSPQPKGAAMGITSRFGWAPSVSYGNVLQVSLLDQPITGLSHGMPAMLCTSASVHAGCSGGALLIRQQEQVKDQSGEAGSLAVAGVITSNSNTAGGTVLPHLNFSIPADLLRDIWRRATEGTLTKGDLAAMDSKTTCADLKNIWNLNSDI